MNSKTSFALIAGCAALVLGFVWFMVQIVSHWEVGEAEDAARREAAEIALDAVKPAIAPQDQPAIAPGIGGLEAQHHHIGTALACLQHGPQGLRADERRVAIKHDDIATKAFQRRGRLGYRMAGAQLVFLHDDLRESMTRNVGIWRDAEGMGQGIADIASFRERLKNVKAHGTSQYNPGWHLAIDLRNMLLVSECIAKAALAREESRGDTPWLVNRTGS